MIGSLKALVVVWCIGWAVLWIAKPIALRFMAEEDYRRRRGLWLGLTAVAFVVPGFWSYALIAAPVLYWAGTRDRNPAALVLLLLHVIPPVLVATPNLGVKLLDFNNFRLLALLVLLPALLRAPPGPPASGAFKLALTGVLGYNLLALVLYVPYEAPTNTIRRLMEYGVDNVLLFYAFYRLLPNAKAMREALVCLCLGTAIVAAVGLFENLRYWLLYVQLTTYWGVADWMAFLMRGSSLRAQASTGHSMTLGFITAVAFGLWLALAPSVPDKKLRWLATAVLLAGSYASLSRASWIMAALAYLVFLLLGPTRLAQMGKQLGVLVLVGAAVLVTPYGEKVINLLPFIGNTDTGNIDYRDRLAELSWTLIWRNPVFGDPFVMRHMESLRQGQGIIDLVNVYASIALFTGLVGLFLFLLPYLTGLLGVVKVAFTRGKSDPSLHALVAGLAAAMAGTMTLLAVGSFGGSVAFMYWALAGMAVRASAFWPQRAAQPHSGVPTAPVRGATPTPPTPPRAAAGATHGWGPHAAR
jgi:hypothetical protein